MPKPQAVMSNGTIRGCVNCRFEMEQSGQYPCDVCSFNDGKSDRWEEKTCQTCRYLEQKTLTRPCVDCQRGGGIRGLKWEPWPGVEVSFVSVGTASAPELLGEAAAIMEERGKQYDQPGGERSMAKTVAAFNIITGHNLSEADGWQFMSVLKDVRLFSNREKTHEDSVKDKIAYGALLGEAAIRKGNLN